MLLAAVIAGVGKAPAEAGAKGQDEGGAGPRGGKTPRRGIRPWSKAASV